MGACCGGMKPGQHHKSLPEKNKANNAEEAPAAAADKCANGPQQDDDAVVAAEAVSTETPAAADQSPKQEPTPDVCHSAEEPQPPPVDAEKIELRITEPDRVEVAPIAAAAGVAVTVTAAEPPAPADEDAEPAAAHHDEPLFVSEEGDVVAPKAEPAEQPAASAEVQPPVCVAEPAMKTSVAPSVETQPPAAVIDEQPVTAAAAVTAETTPSEQPHVEQLPAEPAADAAVKIDQPEVAVQEPVAEVEVAAGVSEQVESEPPAMTQEHVPEPTLEIQPDIQPPSHEQQPPEPIVSTEQHSEVPHAEQEQQFAQDLPPPAAEPLVPEVSQQVEAHPAAEIAAETTQVPAEPSAEIVDVQTEKLQEDAPQEQPAPAEEPFVSMVSHQVPHPAAEIALAAETTHVPTEPSTEIVDVQTEKQEEVHAPLEQQAPAEEPFVSMVSHQVPYPAAEIALAAETTQAEPSTEIVDVQAEKQEEVHASPEQPTPAEEPFISMVSHQVPYPAAEIALAAEPSAEIVDVPAEKQEVHVLEEQPAPAEEPFVSMVSHQVAYPAAEIALTDDAPADHAADAAARQEHDLPLPPVEQPPADISADAHSDPAPVEADQVPPPPPPEEDLHSKQPPAEATEHSEQQHTANGSVEHVEAEQTETAAATPDHEAPISAEA